MGKDSSPLMSGAKTIGFSFAKPKLKASKMSFVRAKKAKAIKAEDLKGPETVSTGSLAATLSETNRILVEIQNQLAIDFANRIAEKKSILQLSRKQVRKKKLIAKEDFVERGKGLVQNIKDFGKKVLSPVKGIFDKIVDFLTIIGTGIAINAAFEWLSDKENREKLVRIFNFLRDHWKTLLAIVIGGKILGLLLKLKGLFSLARSLTRRLKDLFGKNGKFKPGGPDFCAGVMKCVTDKVKSLASILALSIFGVSSFLGGLDKRIDDRIPDPPTTTPPVSDPPVPAPVIPGSEPQTGGNLLDLLLGTNDSILRDPGALISQGLDAALIAALITAIAFPDPASSGAGITGLAARFPGLARLFGGGASATRLGTRGAASRSTFPSLTRSRVTGTGTPGSARVTTGRGATPVAPSATVPARAPAIGSGAKNPISKTVKVKPSGPISNLQNLPKTADSGGLDRIVSSPGLSQRFLQFLKQNPAFRRSGSDPRGLNTIDDFAEFTGTTAQNLIRSQYKNFLTYVKNNPIVARSQGGTIPGKGPTNVDSVPAILAPGEEVIKTSSANMFRPVLKDINDNAGRMFLSFKSGVEQQARNFGLQQEETTRSVSLFKKFGDLVEKQVRKLELKELEQGEGIIDLLNRMQENQSEPETQTALLTGLNSSITQPQASLMSNTTGVFTPKTELFIEAMRKIAEENENNKPKLEPVEQQPVRLEVVPFKPEIQTYTHRRTTSESSGEGSIEMMSVNLPPTVIQGPGQQQQQAQPQEQPSESASPEILIAPMDMDNPFFGRSFSAYGVEL